MKGGCHCGAVRYELLAEPFDADFCHCRDCQRTTGAPVGAWMDYAVDQVIWQQGCVVEYASSATIRRGFCGTCGTSLSYRSTEYPSYLTLSIASLDVPDGVAPRYHIHTSSQLPWLPIDDELPRYPNNRSGP